MANTKKRVAKARTPKVTALPVPEPEQPKYVTLNQQGQVNALLKRLTALENDHFQYSTLIEEETEMGNMQVVPQLQQEMATVEKRIEFIRNKMESIGVEFVAQNAPSEDTDSEVDPTPETEE